MNHSPSSQTTRKTLIAAIILANLQGTSAHSLELDLTYSPTAGFTDVKLSDDNSIPSTGMDGDKFTHIPSNSFSLPAFYNRPIDGDNLNGTFSVDLSYVNERNTKLHPNNPLFIELEDDSVVDVFRIIPGLPPRGLIPQQPRKVGTTLRKRFF